MALTSSMCTFIGTSLSGIHYVISARWGLRKQKHQHWTVKKQTYLQVLSLKPRRERSAQDHQLCLMETCLRCGPNKSQASQLKGHISQHIRGSAFSSFLANFKAVYSEEMIQERNHLWIQWKQDCTHRIISKSISFNYRRYQLTETSL